MGRDQFRHPVAWLNELPPSKRNPTHAVALNACRAVLAGEIDVDAARGPFVAFAQRANVLAPDTGAVVAAGSASAGPGKVMSHIEFPVSAGTPDLRSRASCPQFLGSSGVP